MEATCSLIVMFTSVEAVPPELFAQTVYLTADVCRMDGVPLMAPVVELKDRPLGTAGSISHRVTLPPLMAGVVVAMAVPFSNTRSWEA